MADLKKINSALNVMRRMPPSKIRFNLSGLLNLMPETTDELLQRVDQVRLELLVMEILYELGVWWCLKNNSFWIGNPSLCMDQSQIGV